MFEKYMTQQAELSIELKCVVGAVGPGEALSQILWSMRPEYYTTFATRGNTAFDGSRNGWVMRLIRRD